jgi:uncharacterized protein with FMN-binding domain
VAAMSGLSVAVLGLSFQGSREGQLAAAHTAPVGVVLQRSTPSAPPSVRAVAKAVRTAGVPSPKATRAAVPPSPKAIRTAGVPSPKATRAAAVPSPKATPASVTVNGPVVDTAYGPVQVQITMRAGRVTMADALAYPQDSGQSRDINSQAVPQLDQETVRASSASIDTVSGATYTSDGYRQSLQSALDAAHRAGA